MISLDQLPSIEWIDPDTGAAGRIYADIISDESAQLPAVVTQHPIEEGGKITDHYRKDPVQLRVKCLWSGSPLRGDLDPDNIAVSTHTEIPAKQYPPGAPIFTPGGIFAAAGAAIAAGASALGSLLGLGGSAGPTGFDTHTFDTDPRARFTLLVDAFEEFQAKGILVTMHATFGDFESMAIVNASPHRDADMGDAFEIELDLLEVRFVTSDVTIGAAIPLEPRGLDKKTGANSGNGSEVKGPKKTVAAALFDSARGV